MSNGDDGSSGSFGREDHLSGGKSDCRHGCRSGCTGGFRGSGISCFRGNIGSSSGIGNCFGSNVSGGGVGYILSKNCRSEGDQADENVVEFHGCKGWKRWKVLF